MFTTLRYLLACLLFLCTLASHAQISGNIAESSVQNRNMPFTITSYSTKDGLPQNQVTRILRRNNGELIVHTLNGIVCFNGYRFQPISRDNNYRKQYFKGLVYFAKTDLLLGHDWNDMLYHLAPDYELFHISGCRPLLSIAHNDSLLVVSRTGSLYLHDPISRKSSVLFLNEGPGIYMPGPYATGTLYHGKVYVGGDSGIYCIDPIRKKVTRLSREVCHVLKLNPFNDLIYAVEQNRIAVIREEQVVVLCPIQTSTPHGRSSDILFTTANSIYLATDNGLIHTDGKRTAHYTRADGLPSGALHVLYYDSLTHCLFVGSAEKGLLKLLFKNNYSLPLPDNSFIKSMSSVVQLPGTGIVAAAGNCLYKIGDNATELLPHGKSDYASLSVINDELYAGTWDQGILIYGKNLPADNLGRRRYRPDTLYWRRHLPDKAVHATFKDSGGRIWVGTSYGIARGTTLNNIKPVLSNAIYEAIVCFYELRNGTIAIGTANGLYLVKNDTVLSRFTRLEGFHGKEARSFYEDGQGRLWIGSYGGGLYCYERGRYRSVNAMKNCMLYEDAFCLAKDNYGYLYMTSNRGLWRVREKDLYDFYEGRLGYLVPFHYTEESGFLNTEFNGGFQNNFQREGNQFIFPTLDGLVRTVPEKPVFRPAVASISSIRVNDTLLPDLSNNVFLRTTYSLQFEFQCTNFISKNNVYFQHRLSGKTNYDWSVPQKQTVVNLTMLPPGKYTLSVRAIDAFNERHPRVAYYSFEIRPHFYETAWFIFLMSILLVGTAGVLIRQRLASNRRKIEQREYYRRKITEVELNAIQAQLNPHFIFNCMNTIKYFILEKNFAYANEGLNRLSKLIRASMENSEKLFSPLKQEIALITNYIELEKMRLRELLSYTITVDETISSKALVPHLFIQPHIENAIKHGISNLENKQGVLKIDVRQNKAFIICTIEDNGIGRTASAKLLQNSPHISRGTRLTLEKSQLLKQYYRYKCTIEINDLYNATGESAGTRVVLIMQNREAREF